MIKLVIQKVDAMNLWDIRNENSKKNSKKASTATIVETKTEDDSGESPRHWEQ